MGNEEINYDLTINTPRNTFKFIIELQDLKSMLEQINYKEVNSIQLEKRKVKDEQLGRKKKKI